MKPTVLVFAAHPDDAEFAAGGTLLRLAERCSLTLCTLTDGGAGTHGTPSVRKAEQERAAALLGAKLMWLGKADCTVEYTRAAAIELAQIIRSVKPALVLVPHWNQPGGPNDGRSHPDHVHLGLTVRDAVRFARFRIPQLTGEAHATAHLWYYMAYNAPAQLVLPVDSVMTELSALWDCHASQLALQDGAIKDILLQTRALTAYPVRGVHYAEPIGSDSAISVDAVLQFFGPASS